MPSGRLSEADLEQFLRDRRIDAEMLRLSVLTPTVEQAARAVDSSVDDIVKSLLFLVDGRAQLVITNGRGRVDARALAARCGVGRKRVKLADPAAVLDITGYPVGGLPPFGHHRALPTLIDRSVLGRSVVYAGGGSERALLRISPGEIVRASAGEVVDLSRGAADEVGLGGDPAPAA
jgi:prolyl-tRNA editing enzyme YbaK/EbsC (Cys-tRNA(Pro) deacylase)